MHAYEGSYALPKPGVMATEDCERFKMKELAPETNVYISEFDLMQCKSGYEKELGHAAKIAKLLIATHQFHASLLGKRFWTRGYGSYHRICHQQ